MKTFLMTLSIITLSFTQAYAHTDWDRKSMSTMGVIIVSASPFLGTAATSGSTKDLVRKNAAKMIDEGQEYFAGGEITPFLSAAVKDIQAVYNDEFSQDEIIDALMIHSEALLNN